MEPFGYIGIDFGTSNSHFSYCNIRGDLIPQTIPVGGRPSVSTCVLWRMPAQDEQDIEAIGTEALEAWLDLTSAERANNRFAFGFKPDIELSERARLDAWAFLRRAYLSLKASGAVRTVGVEGGMPVVVGVPAEASLEHQRRTAEIAERAGFGRVECVEEPLGALAFHLNAGDITAAEARQGVVVIDFGGGTLDVSLVDVAGLREPWGDSSLGGRLFDDLFYQWLLDQNTGLAIEPSEEMVVWQSECRELKERFSRRWFTNGSSMNDFKSSINVGDGRTWLRNASVAEFRERAKHFRLSPLAQRYFQGLVAIPSKLANGHEVDLLEWVLHTLTRDGRSGLPRSEFSRIVLTGGSGHWPFVKELAVEAFGIDPAKVTLSSNPETTIGSGLALYNVVKVKNEARRGTLQTHKPHAVAQIMVAVAHLLDRFADGAADGLLAVLMPRVEKVFWDWYKNGGSLEDVEGQIDAICKDFEQRREADGILKENWESLDTDLVRLLREHLKQFLADNEIPKEVSRYIPDAVSLKVGRTGVGKETGEIAGELGDVAASVAALAASIGTVVVAAIKIKLIIVTFFVHPVISLLVAAAALLAFLGIGKAAKDVVENRIKKFEFGPTSLWLLHKVLWESKFKRKLAEGRAAAKADIQAAIRKSTCETFQTAIGDKPAEKPIEQLVAMRFEAVIDLVIQDLTVLELIRPRAS